MRKILAISFGFLLTLNFLNAVGAAESQEPVKEWTLLVFLNGNNNLDSFGPYNINQMEEVGSTSDLNIVVQWASYKSAQVKRVYVQKDHDINKVTSPVIQSMGAVDMGDWKNLVEFVKWGVENYPARHYFVDVWDHGSGWHLKRLGALGDFTPADISHDDKTGHYITTEQLGKAMNESAKIIGHNVDIYGSDACLMAMAEVADEMSGAVDVFLGSEETEPGEGWPYNTFLQAWVQKPAATAVEVSQMLTHEYVKSYQDGVNGSSEVTFSAFDLAKMPTFNAAISGLGSKILSLDKADKAKIAGAAGYSQDFFYSDYKDLGDFMSQVELVKSGTSFDSEIAAVRAAISEFVVANETTSYYAKAQGVAIWLPSSKYTLDRYLSRYRGLKFHKNTGWGDAVASLY